MLEVEGMRDAVGCEAADEKGFSYDPQGLTDTDRPHLEPDQAPQTEVGPIHGQPNTHISV